MIPELEEQKKTIVEMRYKREVESFLKEKNAIKDTRLSYTQ